MRKLPVLAIACLLPVASQVFAIDLERGKTLHDANCIRCHAQMYGGDGTDIYLRQDRRIDSSEGLRNQVERCRDSLGMPWPSDQIDDVVAYLNKHYYKFE